MFETKRVLRMDHGEARVERLDYSGVRGKPRMTAQGFMVIPANLTRTGVLTYRKADGTIQREYRPPEEVFAQESLDSLASCPVTDLHPADFVNPDNVRELQKGHVRSAREDGCMVAGEVVVQDKALLKKVDTKEGKELSPGYTCNLDFTPGVSPEGQRYDCIQRSIVYNHVAIGPVGWGRSGPEVSLRTDGGAVEVRDAEQIEEEQPTKKERSTMNEEEKKKMDALEKENAKLKADKKKDETDAVAKLEAERDTLQAKLDAQAEEIEKIKKIDHSAIAEELASVRAEATPFLPKGYDFKGKSILAIKTDAVKEQVKKLDPERAKSAVYIEARYDSIVESAPKEDESGEGLDLGDDGEERKDGTSDILGKIVKGSTKEEARFDASDPFGMKKINEEAQKKPLDAHK